MQPEAGHWGWQDEGIASESTAADATQSEQQPSFRLYRAMTAARTQCKLECVDSSLI